MSAADVNFITGDVCYFYNSAANVYLHMTNDEHDVGAYWKDRNSWHTFTLTPNDPHRPGIPLRGGDCVWLVGATGKCVDARDGEAKSAPRIASASQQLCLVPLHRSSMQMQVPSTFASRACAHVIGFSTWQCRWSTSLRTATAR